MGDPFRGRALKKWVNQFHKDLSIICLQELKARKDKLKFQLNTLFPQKQFCVDFAVDGRAGATVGILADLPIRDQGVKGDGCFVWITVKTTVGPVSVQGSVYAPNKRSRRKDLWDQMVAKLHNGDWFLAGDWNMTDFFDNSSGPSPHLHGREELEMYD